MVLHLVEGQYFNQNGVRNNLKALGELYIGFDGSPVDLAETTTLRFYELTSRLLIRRQNVLRIQRTTLFGSLVYQKRRTASITAVIFIAARPSIRFFLWVFSIFF